MPRPCPPTLGRAAFPHTPRRSHPDATEDPALREAAFAAGANMVTASAAAVARALAAAAAAAPRPPGSSGGGDGRGLTCTWCGLAGLSLDEYRAHAPLYHVCGANTPADCPACGR
jgi:hypothetical protein